MVEQIKARAEEKRAEERDREERRKEEIRKAVKKEPSVARKPVVSGEAEMSKKKDLPKKPSLFQKVAVRLVITFLILVIVGTAIFWYWYLREEPLPPEKIAPPVEEAPPPVEEEPLPIKGVSLGIQASLISTKETKTLETVNLTELPAILNQFLEEDIEEGVFNQILIKNLENDQWLSFKELLNSFQIEAPEGFYQSLGENFTFFVYSQEKNKRLGFIIEIEDKESLKTLLKSWERTMEQDLEDFFILLGKEGPALISSFRDANYEGTVFRYQTFSKEDLGACHSISEDLFIFTSSYKSMTKVIDKLHE
jgi:hypothetical protein